MNNSNREGKVQGANSAGIVTVETPSGVFPRMYEVVEFPLTLDGKPISLQGEVTEIQGSLATVQTYEGAEGLAIGTPAVFSGHPFICEVAPGMPGVRMSGWQVPQI